MMPVGSKISPTEYEVLVGKPSSVTDCRARTVIPFIMNASLVTSSTVAVTETEVTPAVRVSGVTFQVIPLVISLLEPSE